RSFWGIVAARFFFSPPPSRRLLSRGKIVCSVDRLLRGISERSLFMPAKKIGILTGGGDVPGLNSVIKSVVYSATAQAGHEVIGLRRGWESLTHAKLDKGLDP